jgi:hypothetical protein
MHNIACHRARAWRVLALVAILLITSISPVQAASGRAYDGPLENVVVDWNRHAVEALINATAGEPAGAGQPPPVSSLHVAMVHAAIYDAVMMIDGSYQPYLKTLPRAPRSASRAAAVATAAHDTLVGIVFSTPLSPAILDRLHVARDATLAAATAADGPAAVTAGVAAGQASATGILAARANDGRYGPYRFPESTEPGRFRFRPTDPPIANRFDWVAEVKPFLLESPSQFRTAGPPALTSEQYTKDFNEVKALGSKAGSTRNPEQEALAQFHNLNPVELLYRTFRTMAVDKKLTLAEQARLFAMLGMANADSLITCWADKGYWSFWRPDTAIRLADTDGNPNTAPDPAWEALLAMPPYPDHPSGYNCVAAAFMHAAKGFFGTDVMAFSLVKIAPGAPNVTRNYTRFSQVIEEAIEARICHGVHFRTADVQAAQIGQNVAEWQAQRAFQPTNAMPGLPNTGAGGTADRSLFVVTVVAAVLGLFLFAWGLRRMPR